MSTVAEERNDEGLVMASRIALHDGPCSICPDRIRKGQTIVPVDDRRKEWAHIICATDPDRWVDPDPPPTVEQALQVAKTALKEISKRTPAGLPEDDYSQTIADVHELSSSALLEAKRAKAA